MLAVLTLLLQAPGTASSTLSSTPQSLSSTRRDSSGRMPAVPQLRQSVPPALVPMMKHFVPLPVTELVCSGIFDYMAEMRHVTTLFMKLDGYDCEEHR
jgi:hypothetical protein